VSERHILRAAPEPRLKAIPADEAIDLARTAFHTARREQLELLAGSLSGMLFDPTSVTYRRLCGLQYEARQQVEAAQRVEQLLNDAVEAFEATRP
jgi:hypothetical protein